MYTWSQGRSTKAKYVDRALSCILGVTKRDVRLSPGHTVPIWRSWSLRSEKSWTSAWSAHEVVATSYWHLGSLLGREKIGNDREASTTKFYCKTLSCWSWLCYDLFVGRFQSCVESETSWDCRTQREGIRGQRVGIRRQRMDGREDRINITIASCLIGVTFMLSYISRYAYISVYICLSFNIMNWSIYSWVEGESTLLVVLMRKSRSYSCDKWEWEFK